ncbi:hypothetical protein [Vibrio sagamiensis]|uniref:Uncharacterized protein n=1 Tax=Vibrio sagamiensis NBRC 104589 TaxID=1219064 RepID=A0A511QB59_9VIBR|nr:hypothetical protein [Vibrio sagamiensis]GEM74530.1 hypothetical protein VSA01S_06420 [Vibrio sagamiensis NBRC 104589]
MKWLNMKRYILKLIFLMTPAITIVNDSVASPDEFYATKVTGNFVSGMEYDFLPRLTSEKSTLFTIDVIDTPPKEVQVTVYSPIFAAGREVCGVPPVDRDKSIPCMKGPDSVSVILDCHDNNGEIVYSDSETYRGHQGRFPLYWVTDINNFEQCDLLKLHIESSADFFGILSQTNVKILKSF